jgi:hypothetical protein
MPEPNLPTFAEWCIVELFGHQRYAGLVRQADWPPGFARLEIPATPGHDAVTQLLSPQSIYRLTPTTEAVATAVAEQCRPEPVHRWELPAEPVEHDDESERDPEWYVRQRAEHGALLRMGKGDDGPF